MFHWFGTVTNTKGDSLAGWQVECVQLADGETVVPIYSDESSTPIVNVSGVADRAVTDANGNYDFFVDEGTYSLRFYDGEGSYQRSQRYLPMYGADTAAIAEDAAIAAAEVAAQTTSVTVANAIIDANPMPYDDYFAYSRSIWNEYENFVSSGKFVDKAAGSDGNAGTLTEPLQTLEYAMSNIAEGTPLLLKNGQRQPLSWANRNIGSTGGSGVKREIKNYGGDGAGGPLIDGRVDLSGLTWTVLSGNAWETTVSLDDAMRLNGVNVANSHKFATYIGDPGGNAPEGTALAWKVGGASAAANETEVTNNAGSFSLDVAGEGEIRSAGGSHTSVHMVVHLPDGSDPNGQALFLSAHDAVALFNGGSHGHLQFIGGSGKDSVSYSALSGVIPTFQSITHIDAPCHAGVGARNILGKFTATGKPSPGVPLGDSHGRTLGAMLHLFTPTDHTDQNITINEFDVRNGTMGFYAHGSANDGYNRIDVMRRSVIHNCTTAVLVDGGASSSTSFLHDGLYMHGGVDITESDTAFKPPRDPYWYINGGSFTRSDNDTVPVGNACTLVSFTGDSNTFELKDFNFTMNLNGLTPTFTARRLFAWFPAFGTASSLTPPTFILDNVQDETVIDVANAQRKACFYDPTAAASDYSCRIHMVLENGTTLGSMWGQFNGQATLPASLTMDGDCTIGFGTNTWATFETEMQAAGRSYNIAAGAKLVDGSGNLVDTAATDLVYP